MVFIAIYCKALTTPHQQRAERRRSQDPWNDVCLGNLKSPQNKPPAAIILERKEKRASRMKLLASGRGTSSGSQFPELLIHHSLPSPSLMPSMQWILQECCTDLMNKLASQL